MSDKFKLIFLDFDGVLNSDRTSIAYKPDGYTPEGLDKVAIHLVKALCDITGACIIISSSWRNFYPLEGIRKILATYGWHHPPIIGETPKSVSHRYRGYEVAKFMDEFTKTNEVEAWVCVDDTSDFYIGEKTGDGPYTKNQPLIQTSELNGFSYQNFVACLAILDPNNKNLSIYRDLIREDRKKFERIDRQPFVNLG